jgi:hypothetical protein
MYHGSREMKILQKSQNCHLNLVETFISKLKFSPNQLLNFLKHWRRQAAIPLLCFLRLQRAELVRIWSLPDWHWIWTVFTGSRVQLPAPQGLCVFSRCVHIRAHLQICRRACCLSPNVGCGEIRSKVQLCLKCGASGKY